MSLKYGLLNFLLLCMGLSLALINYEVWTQPMEPTRGNEEATRSGNKPEPVLISEKGNDSPAVNSYLSIAEKNIFSPERMDFPTTTAMVQTKKPMARPQIVLYGVAIVGDYQSATVVNPGRVLRKEERESMTLKIGEKIGEYKLAKILPDRITMEATGDSFDVLLYDPKVPKKRAQTQIADAKTGQPSPVATGAEIQKPGPQATDKPKEPTPERVTPSPPIQFRGNNLPNRPLSRQERSALISQRNASQR
jgi:hypothetical protein